MNVCMIDQKSVLSFNWWIAKKPDEKLIYMDFSKCKPILLSVEEFGKNTVLSAGYVTICFKVYCQLGFFMEALMAQLLAVKYIWCCGKYVCNHDFNSLIHLCRSDTGYQLKI